MELHPDFSWEHPCDGSMGRVPLGGTVAAAKGIKDRWFTMPAVTELGGVLGGPYPHRVRQTLVTPLD